MSDQAHRLREIAGNPDPDGGDNFSLLSDASDETKANMILVTSGKGGVGKTNFVVNLAISLRGLNKSVLLYDADTNLGNLDVFLNLCPKTNVGDVLSGRAFLRDVMIEGEAGIKLIPAAPRMGLTRLREKRTIQRLTNEMCFLSGDFDTVIIDAFAGISEVVLEFMRRCGKVVLITTPEPTSIINTYAMIKILNEIDATKRLKLLINCARSVDEAEETHRKLSSAIWVLLNQKIPYLGFLPYDDRVSRAVKLQEPFVLCYPDVPFSRCLREIGKKLTEVEPDSAVTKPG